MTAARPPAEGDLRAEHDALAERLAVRRSVDEARRAAYATFFGLIAAGLSAKLGYDRWLSTRVVRFVTPPVVFFGVLVLTMALLALALRWWTSSRALMREEAAAFARLQELRRRLGIDP